MPFFGLQVFVSLDAGVSQVLPRFLTLLFHPQYVGPVSALPSYPKSRPPALNAVRYYRINALWWQ